MTLHILGNDLSSLVEQPDSPEVVQTDAGTEVVRHYLCQNALISTLIPAYGAADSVYTNAFFRHARKVPYGHSNYAELYLTFSPLNNNDIIDMPPVGSVWFDISSSARQVPIEQHPNYSTLTDAQKQASSFTEYFQIVTRREVRSTFEMTEANIKGTVGTLEAPKGVNACTEDKWYKTEMGIRKYGDKYEITETWEYSDYGMAQS